MWTRIGTNLKISSATSAKCRVSVAPGTSPGRTTISGSDASFVYGDFGAPGDPEVVVVEPDSGGVAVFGTTQGYGMLVVEGGAQMGDGFRWEGIVLVQADTSRGLNLTYEGDAQIYGALVIHHPNDPVAPPNGLGNFPPNTAWAVDDQAGKLRYFDLTDTTGTGTMSTIGDLLGVDDAPNGERDIEALTIAGNGEIFFTNIEYESTLYKLLPSNIDPAVPADVNAILIATITDSADGSTFDSGSKRFSSLQFVGGTLYGMTNSTEEVYTINTETAVATKIGEINVGSFTTDGMAMLDGVMYLTRTGVNPDHATSYSNPANPPSELWRFVDFPTNLNITQVSVMGNTGKVEALSSHPNGNLYAADDYQWYRIDPQTGEAVVIGNHGGSVDIEGVDFYFPAEEGSHTGGVSGGEEEGSRQITQVIIKDDAKIYYSTEAIGKLATSSLGLTILQTGSWIVDFDHVGATVK